MSGRTTYSDLTGAASAHLAQALILASPARDTDAIRTEADLHTAIRAHRNASAALAQLGRVLTRPPARPAAPSPTQPHPASRPQARARSWRGGPDARTMRTLARRGQPWDWDVEPPAAGTLAGTLWEAARSIRAAADLWATHQSPTGAARSPEASRLRHPSVLGEATREWRALVASMGAIAGALLRRAERQDAERQDAEQRGVAGTDVTGQDLAALRDYPRPMVRRPEPGPGSVRITVARPVGPAGSDPLERITDRIDRVRHAAWGLAEVGTAPVPALANLATIGALLNRVAGDLLDEAGAIDPLTPPCDADPARGRIEAAATRARTAAARWSVVAGLLADLRSPHPPTSVLQLERLDLGRLLEDVRRESRGPRLVEIARELGHQAERLSEVAAMNLRATRAAQARGDLYVLGRALPQETLIRRQDLLEAKLTGRVVPAPAAVVRRLEEAYRAIIDEPTTAAARDGSSPAA